MQPDESKLPDGVERLRGQFYHTDNLLHSRLSVSLICQTLFLLAFLHAQPSTLPAVALAIAGAAATLIFFFTTWKLYWRATWHIEMIKAAEGRRGPMWSCLEMRGLNTDRMLRADRWLMKKATGRSNADADADDDARPSAWLDTGFLFTWGMSAVFVFVWIALALDRIFAKS